jgi:hypothetical protein
MTHRFRSLLGSFVVAFAATAFATQSQAGGLDLGGLVGGTIGGLTGGTGTASSSDGYSHSSGGIAVGAKASVGKSINAKAKVVLLKKKHHAHKGYKGKQYGLVKVYAVIGKNRTYPFHGYKSKNYSLAKVSAKVDTHPVHAKLRLALGKKLSAKGKVALGHKAKVFVKLGSYHHLAKANAVVKTGVVTAKVKLGLGLDGKNHTPGPSTPPNQPTPGEMASRFSDLARSDQQRLASRCFSVLAAPQKYDETLVSLCRMVTL